MSLDARRRDVAGLCAGQRLDVEFRASSLRLLKSSVGGGEWSQCGDSRWGRAEGVWAGQPAVRWFSSTGPPPIKDEIDGKPAPQLIKPHIFCVTAFYRRRPVFKHFFSVSFSFS